MIIKSTMKQTLCKLFFNIQMLTIVSEILIKLYIISFILLQNIFEFVMIILDSSNKNKIGYKPIFYV